MKAYPGRTSNEKEQVKALFLSMNMCKSQSVVNNDIPAKISEIMRQLWSNPKAFRDDDDGHVSSLKVTNRLSMNVAFDCIWWAKKLLIPSFGLNGAQSLQGRHDVNRYV